MSRRSQTCNFSYSDGRRCRMARFSTHPELCPYHAHEQQQLLETQQLGAELSTTLTGHFHTSADINHVLGKLFTASAQGRIKIRHATALAYRCQLMLQSLPGLKHETQFRYTYETWSKLIDQARPLSPPPSSLSPAPSDNVRFSEAAASATRNADRQIGAKPCANSASLGAAASPRLTAITSDCRGVASARLSVAPVPTPSPSSVGPSVPAANNPRDTAHLESPLQAGPLRPTSKTGRDSAHQESPLGVGPLGPTSKTARDSAHLSGPDISVRANSETSPNPQAPRRHFMTRAEKQALRDALEKAYREDQFRRNFKPDSAFLKRFAQRPPDSPSEPTTHSDATEKEEKEHELVPSS